MYESPNDTIALVGKYLSIPLPRDKNFLREHLRDLEATRLQLAVRTADHLQILYEKREQARHPKDKELTDLDRKTMLRANIAVVERDYELLVKLENLVKERLEFGTLLLTL